jgi:CAAX prenyl protease-like protein
MALFMAITAMEGSQPNLAITLYFVKALVVTAALLAFRRPLRDVRFDGRVLLPAIVVGLLVFVEWIVVDPVTPHFGFLGQRSATNPFVAIPDPAVRALFLAVRFYGLVLMVPLMEEIFWRSFLLRWITKPEFDELPVGACNTTAFAAVALLFGFAHQEWLAAILCAAAYALLLRRTRSLFACVVAHGVTNLALGIFILATGQWHYW